MGHYVEYIVDIGLQDILALIDGRDRDFYLARDAGDQDGHFEATIPGTQFDLCFDCGNEISDLCHAEVKYSWLVHGFEKYVKEVEELDLCMSDWLPESSILRVDELLVEQWASSQGREFYDHWKDDRGNFPHFANWLSDQEDSDVYWQRIK